MLTLTHHKKSVRALAIHPIEYSFASGSAGGNNIKKWKCPEGAFVFNFSGHDAIINTLSVNAEGVFFSGGKFLFVSASHTRALIAASPQAIMARSHFGTTLQERLSKIWTISRNLAPSRQKPVSSVPRSI
jgi:WD40 repeat protein